MKRNGYLKKLLGIMLAAFFCFSPVSAFAAETPMVISSGLDMECEEIECTFDDSRIVYGEAEPDTRIAVAVSTMDKHGDLNEVYYDSFVVGSLGIFSVTFPLEMGHNYISLTAELDGMEEHISEVVVKRLPQKVKKQLQQMIALPGRAAQ